MIFVLLIGCSSDDNDTTVYDASNLRLKSYFYQDFIDPIETFFEYNDLGQLSKITDTYRVRNLTYNEKGQLINNGPSDIFYDENGNVSALTDADDNSINIVYNDLNQISKITSVNLFETIEDFYYDSNNRILKTISTIYYPKDILFNTIITEYFYDDSNRIIKIIHGAISSGQEYSLYTERYYEYSNLLNPFRLLYENAGVDPDDSVINLGFNTEGINMGGSFSRVQFPKYMFKKTELTGPFWDDFYVDFNFVKNSYGYPNDGEKIRKSVAGTLITTEESWEYEEYAPSN